MPDFEHQYAASSVSPASIPPYPNPPHLPLLAPPWFNDHVNRDHPPFSSTFQPMTTVYDTMAEVTDS